MLILLIAIVALAIVAFVRRDLLRKAFGELEMSVTKSFRLYSQRINAFAMLIVLPYVVASNGGFVAQAINLLPETYRVIAAPFVGILAFGAVTWARLRIQPKLSNGGK